MSDDGDDYDYSCHHVNQEVLNERTLSDDDIRWGTHRYEPTSGGFSSACNSMFERKTVNAELEFRQMIDEYIRAFERNNLLKKFATLAFVCLCDKCNGTTDVLAVFDNEKDANLFIKMLGDKENVRCEEVPFDTCYEDYSEMIVLDEKVRKLSEDIVARYEVLSKRCDKFEYETVQAIALLFVKDPKPWFTVSRWDADMKNRDSNTDTPDLRLS